MIKTKIQPPITKNTSKKKPDQKIERMRTQLATTGTQKTVIAKPF